MSEPPRRTAYARRLGLFDGVMMTVGGIVGAGIFLNPAIVAQRVGTAGSTLVAWGLGGAIALAGALCFAELGARSPRAGGGYVYLRDAFGSLPAFLYGWTLLLVINSGALAAVAEIASRYSVELLGWTGRGVLPLTIGFILAFTAVNYVGIVPGAMAQNLFTLAKLGALALLIVVGSLMATPETTSPTGPLESAVPEGLAGLVLAMGTALIPVLFAFGGWQNSNFIAEEIIDSRRNLPRAILLGVAVVVTVYMLANVAYLRVLGAAGLAMSEAPASAVLEAVLGRAGATLINVGIVVSTLGILNLFILAAPRVYQAMADDGLFFRAASRLHPRYRTPARALLFQAAWATFLALSGTYGQLLDYVVFGDWIFFGSVAATLFVYRARDAGDAGSEFRLPGYPWVPGLFVLAAAAVVVSSVLSNPGNALLGAGLIASGVPVYVIWRRRGAGGP